MPVELVIDIKDELYDFIHWKPLIKNIVYTHSFSTTTIQFLAQYQKVHGSFFWEYWKWKKMIGKYNKQNYNKI